MLKKIPLDKINVKKNTLFFLSEAPTHHSFTFNSEFLHEFKHKVRLSKTVYGIFHFRFRLVLSKFVFLFNKTTDSLTLKRYNPFQIKNNRKATRTVLLPDLLSCN